MNEQKPCRSVISSAQSEYDALRHVSPEFPCSYLPGRLARHEAYHADQLDGRLYEHLLGRGFRRSGRIVYRPRCRGCCECRQIRIPVALFRPTASMRRVLRRNASLEVTVAAAEFSETKHDLFRRYLEAQHDSSMSGDAESFRSFLCDSPTSSLEFQYHLGRRLVGVSVADRVPSGMSSVYMYFDPDFRSRSLGTFSILWEIEYCRRENLPYYYLGYLVTGCRSMEYKARFVPYEILAGDHRWLAFHGRGAS